MKEYFNLCDETEAFNCIFEKFHPTTIAKFVESTMTLLMERKQGDREKTASLFSSLVKKGALTPAQLETGFLNVLEQALDFEIDYPQIWNYFAEVIAPLLVKKDVPMFFLLSTARGNLIEEGRGLKYVGAIVEKMVEVSALEDKTESDKAAVKKKVGSMWKEAGLGWSLFNTDKDAVAEFVKSQVSFLETFFRLV